MVSASLAHGALVSGVSQAAGRVVLSDDVEVLALVQGWHRKVQCCQRWLNIFPSAHFTALTRHQCNETSRFYCERAITLLEGIIA